MKIRNEYLTHIPVYLVCNQRKAMFFFSRIDIQCKSEISLYIWIIWKFCNHYVFFILYIVIYFLTCFFWKYLHIYRIFVWFSFLRSILQNSHTFLRWSLQPLDHYDHFLFNWLTAWLLLTVFSYDFCFYPMFLKKKSAKTLKSCGFKVLIS